MHNDHAITLVVVELHDAAHPTRQLAPGNGQNGAVCDRLLREVARGPVATGHTENC